MGKPGGSDTVTTLSVGRTWGTETSKYPQEEKVTTIAQVVASERARAQTDDVATHCRGCRVVDSTDALDIAEARGNAHHRG